MCEQCGYNASKYGREGSCEDACHELFFYTLTQPRPPFIHQVAVDAFASQHLQESDSPISQLFGLMGLCMVCEFGSNGLEVQMAHVAKARDPRRDQWPRLGAIDVKFTLNIGDVLASDPTSRDAAIQAWARATWEALQPLHPTIRDFCSEFVTHRS